MPAKDNHTDHKKAAKRLPSFRDRRQFPESGSRLKQLRYLAEGLLPLLRQRTRTRVHALLSALETLLHHVRLATTPRQAQIGVFLTASVLIAILAGFQTLYTSGTTVLFNGVELATVSSEEEAQAARLAVERSISDVVGYQYTVSDSVVSYATHLTARSAVTDVETLETALSDSLNMVEHGYALYVDGAFIGATQTEGAYEELLEQVSAAYRNENTVSLSFVEDISIQEGDYSVDRFTNLADTALLLNSTKTGEVTYTVEAGDCWSMIAQDHDLTSKELETLNPGYDIDKLQIGDVLLISRSVPYLTVVATQMEYYTTQVPYEIEYVDDDSMWQGDTRVLTKGVYGSADVEAKVTYQGAEEVERVVITETITTQPTTEIQARGTKERPSWAPTGTFRWPTSGTITSPFGYRYIFGSTSFHGGIDIANRKGTNIVAADGGIVSYAGWKSGYGYVVIIDHTNGYETYYAHCSQLLVSAGDKVYKGEHIAEMGSTGRSTGNHLHFEVRYGGERKNPINYLP